MTNLEALKADDLRSRERILRETDQNFFVQASAGSGKTTSLVGRMTAMVKQGIPVRQICAITFTKNAAAEFYHRFQKKLSEEAENAENPQVQRERCQAALNEIDLAFMETIDAFCDLILHEHPAQAQIPADAGITEDREMEAVYAREYARISNGEYTAELRRKADRFVRLVREPKKAFVGGMLSLAELRHTEIRYPKPDNEPFSVLHRAAIETLLHDLELLVSRPALALPVTRKGSDPDKFKKQLEGFASQLPMLHQPEKWDNAPNEVLRALEELHGYRIVPDSTPVSLGLHDPDLLAEGMNNRKKVPELSHYEVRIKEHPLYQALAAARYADVMDFLCDAAGQIAAELRCTGELTFFDNLLYLRDMLKADAGRNGTLIRYITRRHSYFLIDEFQDTNPLQAEIFFYLAAEAPEPDWRKCRPRPGSLFIVGDPKQSIYRYRSADVSAFLQVRTLFEKQGGSVLTLRQNFRSAPQLCEWFNGFFTRTMPEQTADQSAYEPIPEKAPFSAADCLTGVYTYRLAETANDAVLAEDAAAVCEIIRRLAYHPEYTIQTASDAAPRMIRYSDFMVIGRGKKRFIPYTDALSAYGIPARVEGELLFTDCPALVSLAGILNAAANPHDKQALYLAWTAPAAGLTQNDLLTLQQAGLTRSIQGDYEKVLAAYPHLLTYAQNLKTLSELAKTLPFPQLAEKAVSLMRLCETAGTAQLEDLCYALELLRRETQDGKICCAKDGAAFLMQMITAPAQERSLSLDRGADAVHFANLHKVKGLEAPIVILAVPVRAWKYTVSKRTEYSEAGAKSWFFEIAGLRTACYPDAEQAEKDTAAAENLRLLYVAATRAKCALIIADRRTSKDTYSKDNFWHPFLDMPAESIFDRTADAVLPEQVQRPVRQCAERLSLADDVFRAPRCVLMTPSKIKHGVRPVSRQQDAETLREKARPDANLVGTMVHKLMESIISAGDRAEKHALCKDICREFEADAAKYQPMLETVYDRMHSGGYPQSNGESDLLPKLLHADEVHCELPFSLYQGEALWYGVIDVVYRENGRWHIVDYKTNADGEELDTVYAGQLLAYQNAFRKLTGEQADVRTYHIHIQ